MYASEEKRLVIGKLMEDHMKSLEAEDRFHGEVDGGLEAPTVYLWCLYYLAQHYDLQGEIRYDGSKDDLDWRLDFRYSRSRLDLR